MPLRIFTTRPDTIYGVSFLAIAHDNPKIKELLNANEENWIDRNAYDRYLLKLEETPTKSKEINLEDMD